MHGDWPVAIGDELYEALSAPITYGFCSCGDDAAECVCGDTEPRTPDEEKE